MGPKTNRSGRIPNQGGTYPWVPPGGNQAVLHVQVADTPRT